MSTTAFFFLFLILFSSLTTTHSLPTLNSPYLSPTIIFPNYQKMLNTFSILIYHPNTPLTFQTQAESIFYTSLLNSPFATRNAEQAHLFFVPFSSDLSTRSIARLVRGIRSELPYWNRTLGADHFFVSCAGIGYESDRNLVELKKNSVQISCFPATPGKFVPHKDISMPPVTIADAPVNNNRTASVTFLGYLRSHGAGGEESTLVRELAGDPDFVIETEPSDQITYAERLRSSKFCLFDYGNGGFFGGIGEALRYGCVPAVISDRPIHDLPFLDVLRWQEMAVFVGRGGGAREVKSVLEGTSEEAHARMKELGAASSQHFMWNEAPEPLDCFNTLMYQLWLRRHSIRYAR